jgi:hypothetical protein
LLHRAIGDRVEEGGAASGTFRGRVGKLNKILGKGAIKSTVGYYKLVQRESWVVDQQTSSPSASPPLSEATDQSTGATLLAVATELAVVPDGKEFLEPELGLPGGLSPGSIEGIGLYTNLFVGRLDVLDRLDEFVTRRTSGSVLLAGDCGAGKSATLAQWATNAAVSARVACHFFHGGGYGGRSLRHAYEHLVAQLWGFGRPGDAPTAQSLPELEGQFMRLLRTSKSGERLYIVLDALDQCETSFPAPYGSLPDGVFIIASCQTPALFSDTRFQAWLSSSQVISLSSGLTSDDVRNWLRRRDQSRIADDDVAVNLLCDRTSGYPMYLKLVIDELAAQSRGEAAVRQYLQEMPAQLSAFLSREMQQVAQEAGVSPEVTRGVLALVVAAAGPIEVDEVAQILRVDSWSVNLLPNSLKKWVGFELQEGGAWTLHVTNDVFREFAQRSLKAEVTAKRQLLLDHCAAWAETGSRYAARYLSRHLIEAGDLQSLYRLARNSSFRDFQSQVLPNGASATLDLLMAAASAASGSDAYATALEFLLEHSRRLQLAAIGGRSIGELARDGRYREAVWALDRLDETPAFVWKLAVAASAAVRNDLDRAVALMRESAGGPRAALDRAHSIMASVFLSSLFQRFPAETETIAVRSLHERDLRFFFKLSARLNVSSLGPLMAALRRLPPEVRRMTIQEVAVGLMEDGQTKASEHCLERFADFEPGNVLAVASVIRAAIRTGRSTESRQLLGRMQLSIEGTTDRTSRESWNVLLAQHVSCFGSKDDGELVRWLEDCSSEALHGQSTLSPANLYVIANAVSVALGIRTADRVRREARRLLRAGDRVLLVSTRVEMTPNVDGAHAERWFKRAYQTALRVRKLGDKHRALMTLVGPCAMSLGFDRAREVVESLPPNMRHDLTIRMGAVAAKRGDIGLVMSRTAATRPRELQTIVRAAAMAATAGPDNIAEILQRTERLLTQKVTTSRESSQLAVALSGCARAHLILDRDQPRPGGSSGHQSHRPSRSPLGMPARHSSHVRIAGALTDDAMFLVSKIPVRKPKCWHTIGVARSVALGEGRPWAKTILDKLAAELPPEYMVDDAQLCLAVCSAYIELGLPGVAAEMAWKIQHAIEQAKLSHQSVPGFCELAEYFNRHGRTREVTAALREAALRLAGAAPATRLKMSGRVALAYARTGDCVGARGFLRTAAIRKTPDGMRAAAMIDAVEGHGKAAVERTLKLEPKVAARSFRDIGELLINMGQTEALMALVSEIARRPSSENENALCRIAELSARKGSAEVLKFVAPHVCRRIGALFQIAGALASSYPNEADHIQDQVYDEARRWSLVLRGSRGGTRSYRTEQRQRTRPE